MQIQLNGDAFEAVDGLSLTGLVAELGLTGKRIAIELNREIVPRSEHASTVLRAGDSVEVVVAIGGG